MIAGLVADLHPRSTYARLFDRYGSATATTRGVGHFRAVYESEPGDIVVVRPVPGATVTGTGPPGGTLTASTEVEVPGASFTYERRVEVAEDGTFAATVAYPGTYLVGDATVTVPARAVEAGRGIAVGAVKAGST